MASALENLIIIKNKPEFKRLVLNAEMPVVVDFWADWCGPCKTMAPIFERVAKNHPEVRFAKVDTEKAREVAQAANIRSLPTIAFFYNGELKDVFIGAKPEAQLEKAVQRMADKAAGKGLFNRMFGGKKKAAPEG